MRFCFASENQKDGINEKHISSCVIKAKHSSAILMKLIKFVLKKLNQIYRAGETGPRLVHALVNKHGLQKYVKDTQFFNPVDYFHFNQILIERDNEIDLSLSVAVHLWNEK